MEALDCPDASQLTPRREASVTAIQALAMLNDAFIVRQSEHAAVRIAKEAAEPSEQVRMLYRLAVGRPARDDEVHAMAEYAARHGMANACRMMFNCNEFIFVQ